MKTQVHLHCQAKDVMLCVYTTSHMHWWPQPITKLDQNPKCAARDNSIADATSLELSFAGPLLCFLVCCTVLPMLGLTYTMTVLSCSATAQCWMWPDRSALDCAVAMLNYTVLPYIQLGMWPAGLLAGHVCQLQAQGNFETKAVMVETAAVCAGHMCSR